MTPEQVRAAMQRWLTRPVSRIRVDPGERPAYQEAPGQGSRSGFVGGAGGGGGGGARRRRRRLPSPRRPRRRPGPAPASRCRRDRHASGLDFPATERARLSNGIQIIYARRAAVPVTRIAVEFNAGIAADPANRLGTQAMMLNLLEEGTTSLNSVQLAEAQERLGATIGTGASLDRTTVTLTALSAQLGASLDLLADVVRNPAFAPAEVERIRQQQLAGIAAGDDPAAGHGRCARCPA